MIEDIKLAHLEALLMDAKRFDPKRPHFVARVAFLGIQVCSTGTEEEALAWVREAYPAGTSGNWGRSDQESVLCEDVPGRKHYVFNC